MRTYRIEMNAIAGVVILLGSLMAVVVTRAPSHEDCASLRDENGEIICSDTAYQTWLNAGREDSKLDSLCHGDLVELTQRCNMADFLDSRLSVSLETGKTVSRRLFTYLLHLLNHTVIKSYNETHPNETLHLDERGEEGCCRSEHDYPIKDALNSFVREKCWPAKLIRNLGIQEDSPDFHIIEDAVSRCAQVYVFKPCARYLYLMDDLFFGQLKDIVDKTKDNDQSFLENQSEEFKDAVFRYQFCSSLDVRDLEQNYKGLNYQYKSTLDEEDVEELYTIMNNPKFKNALYHVIAKRERPSE